MFFRVLRGRGLPHCGGPHGEALGSVRGPRENREPRERKSLYFRFGGKNSEAG